MYAMNPVVQKLHEVRNLLAKPRGWCQDALARRRNGFSVSPESSEAESFCLLGANRHVGGGRVVTGFIRDALKRIYGSRCDGGIANTNDFVLRKQSDALAVIDEAIVIAAASDAPQSKSSRTKNKTR